MDAERSPHPHAAAVARLDVHDRDRAVGELPVVLEVGEELEYLVRPSRNLVGGIYIQILVC